MKIGKLSELSHCSIQTIRYYENEGLIEELDGLLRAKLLPDLAGVMPEDPTEEEMEGAEA